MGFVETMQDRVQSAVEQFRERIGRNPIGDEPVYSTQSVRVHLSDEYDTLRCSVYKGYGGYFAALEKSTARDSSVEFGKGEAVIQKQFGEWHKTFDEAQGEANKVFVDWCQKNREDGIAMYYRPIESVIPPSYISELKPSAYGTISDGVQALVLRTDDGLFYPGSVEGGGINHLSDFKNLNDLGMLNYSLPELTYEDAQARAEQLAKAHIEHIDEHMEPPYITQLSESRWDQIGIDLELKEHLGKSVDGFHYAVELSDHGGDSGNLSWSKPYADIETARTELRAAADSYRDDAGERDQAWEARQIAEFEQKQTRMEERSISEYLSSHSLLSEQNDPKIHAFVAGIKGEAIPGELTYDILQGYASGLSVRQDDIGIKDNSHLWNSLEAIERPYIEAYSAGGSGKTIPDAARNDLGLLKSYEHGLEELKLGLDIDASDPGRTDDHFQKVDNYHHRVAEVTEALAAASWRIRDSEGVPAQFEETTKQMMRADLNAGKDPMAIVEAWADWQSEKGNPAYFGRLLYDSMTATERTEIGSRIPADWTPSQSPISSPDRATAELGTMAHEMKSSTPRLGNR